MTPSSSRLMGSNNIPLWLRTAHSSSHLEASLRILSDREILRGTARNHSRHQSNPSHSSSTPNVKLTTKAVEHYSVSVGYQPNNQWGNRYMDIEPYDRTRVIFEQGPMEKDQGVDKQASRSRYLNGNWVRELFGGKWWIATQAPLPTTSHAFLSVILQPISRPPASILPSPSSPRMKTSRIRTVVQLTQNVESGRRKAHDYFPVVVGQSWVISPEPGHTAPPIKVTLLASQIMEEAHCIQSTISIVPVTTDQRLNEEPVVFRHMLYSAWPDHGIPEPKDHATLLSFLRLVDRTNKDTSYAGDVDPDPPIIVGCSAGVGRTGAFIALSSLLHAHDLISGPSSAAPGPTPSAAQPSLPPSPLGPLPNDLQEDLVAHEVDSLREQRPSMVQRGEQILLIYEVLALAFMK